MSSFGQGDGSREIKEKTNKPNLTIVSDLAFSGVYIPWNIVEVAQSDSLQPHGLYSSWNSLGRNTGVGNCSTIQGIFPTQGSNLGLLHCRPVLYQLCHQGSPQCIRVVVKKKKIQFLNELLIEYVLYITEDSK